MARPKHVTPIEPLERRQLFSADLAPTFAGPFPADLDPAGGSRFVVRVANGGDAAAAGFEVELFASADGTLDAGDAPLAIATRAKAIRAGRSATVKVPVALPPSLAEGNYQILARAGDPGGAADANPANDVATGPAAVAVRQPFADVGVAVTAAPAGPVTTAGRGRRPPPRAAVTVDVFNAGNVVARGPMAVGLYLSADAVLDAGDTAVAADAPRVLRVKPGQARSVRLTFRVPAAVPAGTYTVLAMVTPAAEVGDRTAANNVAAGPRAVTVVNTPLPRPPKVDRYRHHYGFDAWSGDVFFYDDYATYGYVDGAGGCDCSAPPGVLPPPPEPYSWVDPDPLIDPDPLPVPDPWTDPEPYVPPEPPVDDPPATQPSTGPSTTPSTQPSTQPSPDPWTQPSPEPSTGPPEPPSTQPSTEPPTPPDYSSGGSDFGDSDDSDDYGGGDFDGDLGGSDLDGGWDFSGLTGSPWG